MTVLPKNLFQDKDALVAHLHELAADFEAQFEALEPRLKALEAFVDKAAPVPASPPIP